MKKSLKSALSKTSNYVRDSMVVVIVAFVLSAVGAVCTIVGPDKLGEITNLISDGLIVGIDMQSVARAGITLAALYKLFVQCGSTLYHGKGNA
mgnify:CR=1 FL=1